VSPEIARGLKASAHLRSLASEWRSFFVDAAIEAVACPLRSPSAQYGTHRWFCPP